jgi:hypothetical protein
LQGKPLCESYELKDMLVTEELHSDHPGYLEASGAAVLPAGVRDHLGRQLQVAYAALITARPPQRLLDLIAQLDSALAGQDSTGAAAFRQGMIEMLPGLRAFAMSLVPKRRAPMTSCRRRC